MSCPEDFASSVRAGDRGARGMGHLWHASGGGSAPSLFRLCAYPCWKSLRVRISLDASERTQVSAYPSPASRPADADFFLRHVRCYFWVRVALPTPAEPSAPPAGSQKTLPRFFCALPGRGWYPHASAEPSVRPARSQIRIGVPRSRPRKHAAKDFSRSTRRCSWTRGHYPRLRSPLLEPVRMRSLLLAASAPRRTLACPDPAPENTPLRIFRGPPGAVPGRGGTTRAFGALCSNPFACGAFCLPRALPRIGVPRSRPRKHAAKNFFLRPIRRCSRTQGHYPRLRSPLLKPPSPAEPPARPERSQTRIGVPNLPLDPPRFQPHLGVGGISKFALPAISAQSPQPGIHSDVYPPPSATTSARWASTAPAVSLPPSTTPVFPVLLPSVSLGPGFSRTVQNFSRTLSEIFFAFPLILHHLPSPSHISGPHPAASHNNPQRPQAAMSHHQSNKAKFLTYRATRPYAKEGPGWCYNVACAADVDIAQHAAGTPHRRRFFGANEMESRPYERLAAAAAGIQGLRRREDPIWICGWEVSRRYYCERLAQLEELCDGGERATIDCVCGVSHREYFSFATVGGFTEFNPCAVPTKAIHWPDEDDVRVGFRADKGDVRVYFSADKGDVRAGSYADKGDVQLGLFTDKDDVLTKLHADKDSTHKARRGPSWGCHAGHGMGARRAAT
ncbi:hypothetical protein B0H14DRAFT_3448974 [Mycena olivaceomarginata]|nr:hypothetical protein B0H14DRAFT_3448974 [Mycena olivaceomarginata]